MAVNDVRKATAEAALVYVTVPNAAEAQRIGRAVVSERLAACANIVPQLTSIYWWEGELQEDGESLLLLKTRAALFERLRERIAQLHPYEVPAISMIPLSAVHEPYLTWLIEETAVPSE